MVSNYRLISWRKVLATAVLVAAVVGCSSVRPYESRASWVLRQNAVPQYFATYDVFYVYPAQSEESVWMSKAGASTLYDDAKHRLCEVLGKKVRVFSPCVRESAAVQDTAEALRHYLVSYHDEGRPFQVVVEGRDEAFVEALRKEMGKKFSAKNGFIALHREDRFDFGPELTRKLSDEVRQRAMCLTWGQPVKEEN